MVSDNDSFNKIKNFMFENPSFKGNEISLSTIVQVLGIYLRDIVIQNQKDDPNVPDPLPDKND